MSVPAVVLIEGDSGTGKTRLSEEVAARARLDGAVVCPARSVPADREEPWNGVLALAGSGMLEAPGLPAAAPGALAHFARHLSGWADRFPDARPVEPESAGRALRDVLEAVTAERAVLLTVDDVQNLDRDSLLAIAALPRDLPRAPLLVVLTASSHPPRDEVDQIRARIGREVDGVVLRLGPLEGAAIRALIRWAFPLHTPDQTERLVRRLAADSAGLPLLLVELVHAVAHGMEMGEAAAWPEPLQTLDQSLPGDLPETIVGAIRAGFRRLSAEAQQVLAAASLVEGRIAPDRLARVMTMERSALERALDELEWQRWLVSEPRGYVFTARIARDVISRDMLTPGQRARLVERM